VTGPGGRPPAAVLFDMDGTLVDSEKIWDVTLAELASRLGGELSAPARAAMVGSNLASALHLLHDDLGVVEGDLDSDSRWLLDRTKHYFTRGLPWQPGARELLEAVHAAGIPTALVTSTHRDLVDVALRSIGAHFFDIEVCGDEVSHNKPHPEAYLTAAAMLGAATGDCVAIEDSPTGISAAEAAGCAVLAVPSEVPVPPGPLRTVRESLQGVDVEYLTGLLAR
jgi:HAD superfamily hydrolase (TIGR01509 family)